MKVKELVIVEGKGDVAAVKQAVEAEVLEVHGFGVNAPSIKEAILYAAERVGIIILTDPDHGGRQIRRVIKGLVPHAKCAYISREEGTKEGDIGVENASPEGIRRALQKARVQLTEEREEFSREDMVRYGLAGGKASRKHREALGQTLRIGYANAKQFRQRLNHYGICREELEKALEGLSLRLPS